MQNQTKPLTKNKTTVMNYIIRYYVERNSGRLSELMLTL